MVSAARSSLSGAKLLFLTSLCCALLKSVTSVDVPIPVTTTVTGVVYATPITAAQAVGSNGSPLPTAHAFHQVVSLHPH